MRWFQAVPWAGVSVVLAATFGRRGAVCVLALDVALAVFWKALVVRYGRRRNPLVSAHRLTGDRVMRETAAIAFAPLIPVVVIAAIGFEPLVSPAWTVVALSIPLLSILASSLLDWYVVLPFRDGVEGAPVCKAKVGISRRRRYTKLLVAHRLACESSIAVSLLIAAVLIVNHYGHGVGAIVSIVSFLGGASIAVGLAWKRWFMGGLRFCLRQGPALGGWVEGQSHTHDRGYQRCEGFVRDVSLDNGVKVVASADGEERFIALVDAVPDISRQSPGAHCAGVCETWLRNGDEVTCEVHLLAAAARP